MKKISLTKQLILASILGILAGYILGPNVTYIKFVGDIFLRLVQVVVPILVFCAIIDSIGSLNIKELGSIGVKTLGLFLITTTIAGALGLLFGNVFQSTANLASFATGEYTGYMLQGSFIDLIVNFIPKNIFQAFAEGTIIQILVFGVFLGVAISLMKHIPAVEQLFETIKTINLLMMRIVEMFMKVAPYGIFALLANTLGTKGLDTLIPLAQYVLTVTGANLVFFAGFTLFISMYLKVSPIQLIKNVGRTIIVGVATGSSAMSVPMEFKDCRERLGLSDKITNFAIPLGMSINTNGAAITTTIASLTCAHLFGIELTLQNQIFIGLCAVLATFGNTTVPGGGIVAVAVVFQMVGLPLEGVAIFAGVDYFTGLTRIIVNVVTDIYCGLMVGKGEKAIDFNVFNKNNKLIDEELAAKATATV